MDVAELRLADGLFFTRGEELYGADHGEVSCGCGGVEGVFAGEWGGGAELDAGEGCGQGGCGAVSSE